MREAPVPDSQDVDINPILARIGWDKSMTLQQLCTEMKRNSGTEKKKLDSVKIARQPDRERERMEE